MVDHDSALRPVSFMISYLDRYLTAHLSVGSYLLWKLAQLWCLDSPYLVYWLSQWRAGWD